jgi:hypothetical protein
MLLLVSRSLPAILTAAALVLVPGIWAGSALAQGTGEQKPAEAQKQEPAREGQRNQADFAEAARTLGGPAATPECVWHGRRIISLLWRDDIDTAFRHLDLYDRFGCPASHVQASLRCLLGQDLDPKATGDAISRRAQACWVNPAAQPGAAATNATAPAAAPAPAAAGQAPAAGTTTR